MAVRFNEARSLNMFIESKFVILRNVFGGLMSCTSLPTQIPTEDKPRGHESWGENVRWNISLTDFNRSWNHSREWKNKKVMFDWVVYK